MVKKLCYIKVQEHRLVVEKRTIQKLPWFAFKSRLPPSPGEAWVAKPRPLAVKTWHIPVPHDLWSHGRVLMEGGTSVRKRHGHPKPLWRKHRVSTGHHSWRHVCHVWRMKVRAEVRIGHGGWVLHWGHAWSGTVHWPWA